MKHKVSELDGALLDFAVMRALGEDPELMDGACIIRVKPPFDHLIGPDFYRCEPSKNWSAAGPIIEKYRIALYRDHPDCDNVWEACVGGYESISGGINNEGEYNGQEGFTPLIAAMRSFVFSKFGKTVDLPE
jgi:hypothetical protein